jgi:hypothetical protein
MRPKSHRDGGEQWSEHFTFSQPCFNVAYAVCERRFAVCYAPLPLHENEYGNVGKTLSLIDRKDTQQT